MAEGRMLKRVISTSPRLAALKNDTHRLIYTWMIPFLDVEGRIEADPRIIKGHIIPLLDHVTTKIIDAALVDMAANDLIVLYEANGLKYLQLQRFAKHQTLREGRERKSDIPSPTDGVPTALSVATDVLPPNKIREDKIREGKEKHADSVMLSQTEYKKLQEAIGQKNLELGIEKLDYSITVKGGKYKDHYKTILNWHKRGFLIDGNNGNGRREGKPPGANWVPKEYKCEDVPDPKPRDVERVNTLVAGFIKATEMPKN